MTVKLIDNVINEYKEQDVRDFLNYPNRRAETYKDGLPIQKSIENIIHKALDGVLPKNEDCFPSVKKSDMIIFPDVHGRLDLFVQNLYVAGLIDKDGNWAGGRKTAVLLGDLINRGPYSVETLIYSRVLQQQSKASGGNFEVLMGNHEHCIINDLQVNNCNIRNPEIAKKIILENIERGNTKIAFSDNERNIFCVHAGVEKEILKWSLREIKPELSVKLAKTIKVSSEEISNIMGQSGIELTDVASWMNNKFKKELYLGARLTAERPTETEPQGVLNSRKKESVVDKQDISKDKPYKMTQIVGHTTTNYRNHLRNATYFGAIKKINHRFYLDFDLLRGNRTFVAIEGNKVHQITTRENGLDNDKVSIQIGKYGLKAELSEHPEMIPGIAKKLVLENWYDRHIATLPRKTLLLKRKNEKIEIKDKREY